LPLINYRYRLFAEGGFENGIEMWVRATQVSPEFRFRVEQDPTSAFEYGIRSTPEGIAALNL
jgi:hypothetical protein